MATFTEIYYNGNEYKEMWLNGTKIWEKDNGGGEIVYPYPDADSVITFMNTTSSAQILAFDIIDSSLPYSINGTSTTNCSFPASSETQVKFVNLKPRTNDSYVIPINIEQLRLPNLTDLSSLFCYFCYDSNYTYSWSPQYFEFHPNPTVMEYMFYYCLYLTDEMMTQFMPYFPNTSEVTNMSYLFGCCEELTSLDVSSFDTSKVTTMEYMFGYCNKLTSLDVSSFDTSSVTNMREMFYTCSSLTSLDLSNFDTSNVTTMEEMFGYCSSLTELDLSNFDTREVTNMNGMFYNCSSLTELDLSSFDTSNVTNMNGMFYNCYSLTELDLSSFDTSNVANMNGMFSGVSNCTIYINTDKWTLGTSSTLGNGTNLTFVPVVVPIESINGITTDINDTTNATEQYFTVTPNISPSNYSSDLEVIYDSTYLKSKNNKDFELLEGSNGQTLSITYRSKSNNSISETITFTVSEDLEIIAIDFTQSTAPELPDYMSLDGEGSSYYFSHGTYTTDVYGLVPNNNGIDSTTAYTRYKFVAPKDGALTFTYRCYAETDYDYLTVHVDTSTSQPSYDSSTNQVLTTYGVSSYENTDGTASVNVTSGTTYYIHIQYYKDSSGHNGYDKGCIRKIELL